MTKLIPRGYGSKDTYGECQPHSLTLRMHLAHATLSHSAKVSHNI